MSGGCWSWRGTDTRGGGAYRSLKGRCRSRWAGAGTWPVTGKVEQVKPSALPASTYICEHLRNVIIMSLRVGIQLTVRALVPGVQGSGVSP